MTVSISDQVLIVWPTPRPKYSFTSQNPASLTWEKNSDPEPIARTSSEVWAGSYLDADILFHRTPPRP